MRRLKIAALLRLRKTAKKLKTAATILDRGLVGDLLANGVKSTSKQRKNNLSFPKYLFHGFRCCC